MHTGAVRPEHPRRWSLARQLLVLQAVLVVVLVCVAAAAASFQDRAATQEQARQEVTAVAQTLAASPTTSAAMTAPGPSTVLAPWAERVRAETGVYFVTFMAPDGTRWSHPNPSMIGRKFVGTTAPALAGETFTETFTGTLGPSVRAVAPVREGGRVVGLVAVGISTDTVGAQARSGLPEVLAAAAAMLAVALAGATLVSRRLRRQTRGLAASDITRLVEHYEAVLHSVREGLLLVGADATVLLVNDAARELLDLGGAPPGGERLGDLGLPPSIAEAVLSGRAVTDELHLTARRVLVLTQADAVWEGRRLGTVLTLRDHTELQDLVGELDAVQALAEQLRSQAHESANRLHTVVSLLELGRTGDAVRFATDELVMAQGLADAVVDGVEEPVCSAVLLAKSAAASERGLELLVTPDSRLDAEALERCALPARDVVTVLGNLVDNAVDAVAGARVRGAPARVTVTVREAGPDELAALCAQEGVGRPPRAGLLVRVADTGPGLGLHAERAFTRGWSTKPAAGEGGRGIGLALVAQVVSRLGGGVDVSTDPGGAMFTVVLPAGAGSPAETAGDGTASRSLAGTAPW